MNYYSSVEKTNILSSTYWRRHYSLVMLATCLQIDDKELGTLLTTLCYLTCSSPVLSLFKLQGDIW